MEYIRDSCQVCKLKDAPNEQDIFSSLKQMNLRVQYDVLIAIIHLLNVTYLYIGRYRYFTKFRCS